MVPVLQKLDDHLSEMKHVDNHFMATDADQLPQNDFQHRHTVNIDQCLRAGVGEWSEPAARTMIFISAISA